MPKQRHAKRPKQDTEEHAAGAAAASRPGAGRATSADAASAAAGAGTSGAVGSAKKGLEAEHSVGALVVEGNLLLDGCRGCHMVDPDTPWLHVVRPCTSADDDDRRRSARQGHTTLNPLKEHTKRSKECRAFLTECPDGSDRDYPGINASDDVRVRRHPLPSPLSCSPSPCTITVPRTKSFTRIHHHCPTHTCTSPHTSRRPFTSSLWHFALLLFLTPPPPPHTHTHTHTTPHPDTRTVVNSTCL
jgi:hypothetical protein